MGVSLRTIRSYYEFNTRKELVEQPKQVLSLVERSLIPLIDSGALPDNLSHVIVSTTCPDSLAPSLGQMIGEKFHEYFSRCHSIDIVQGCAGGVTAMILGSQLAELNRSPVLVIQADAARKATSKSKKISKIFGNGSCSCLITHDSSNRKLIHYKSQQYKGLSEVVTVKLGHDADRIIIREKKDMTHDPRIHLGLHMDNGMAIKLLGHAERFYLDFVNESASPDVMILHQVNPMIIRHLKSVFSKYNMEFVNVSERTGNCGAASVGIALSEVMDTLQNKKVLLCSFGTGGVITAGLWQN